MASLTVLFSSFNGAGTLPRMLHCLEKVQPPSGGWRIVAVDNGSADSTPAILSEAAQRLPLTVVSEPRRGKTRGLNAGLPFVEGDLLVLTDDDVAPRPDWLVSLRRVADSLPAFDVFGGAVYPVWPAPPPLWLLRWAPRGHFAWTDFREGPAKPTQIWGPNMAVRTHVLAGRRFAEDIGPDGGARYATGAETEFVLRLSRDGHLCWHAPDVVVGHMIEPRQLTMNWLLQRTLNHGLGTLRLFMDHYSASSRPILGAPRRLLSRGGRKRFSLAVSRLVADVPVESERRAWRAQELARAISQTTDDG